MRREFKKCIAAGCTNRIVAKQLCPKHYQESLRKRWRFMPPTENDIRFDHRKRSSILIRDLDMRPLFVMDFYGLDDELTTVGPDMGGNIVAAALTRRGIDPHSVSFGLFDVAPDGALRSPLWSL